jgi:LCP family protein required for cell wall assembly
MVEPNRPGGMGCLGLLLLALLGFFGFTTVSAQVDWDGQSRFTVLVLGMDRRPDAPASLSARTDAMLLLSVDPATQTIGMLHIPRDVHMEPPQTQRFTRINTLMVEGENIQQGYGPYYAMDTLQWNLGIYIDAYIAFDFEAFVAVVDWLDGIEITINYPISDPAYPDMFGGFDPFYLERGTHLLNGADALRFARTRHGDNDFLRGERQMQVLQAIHQKVTAADLMPRLITGAPQLLGDLNGHVYTDLALEDMIQLATYAVNIPRESIATGSMDEQYQTIFIMNGQTVLIPEREKLLELMVQTFGDDYAP